MLYAWRAAGLVPADKPCSLSIEIRGTATNPVSRRDRVSFLPQGVVCRRARSPAIMPTVQLRQEMRREFAMPIPSLRAPNPIIYPDCDGEPIAENTLQFEYIVTIKEGLEWEFRDDNVFVAGDLFWYPEEGHPEIRTAPDTLLVFGRPKKHRYSYLQWEEEGIAPQVTFEVLSPSNRAGAQV